MGNRKSRRRAKLFTSSDVTGCPCRFDFIRDEGVSKNLCSVEFLGNDHASELATFGVSS
jgi:hypothetical protein